MVNFLNSLVNYNSLPVDSSDFLCILLNTTSEHTESESNPGTIFYLLNGLFSSSVTLRFKGIFRNYASRLL